MACEREKINSFNVTGSAIAGILVGKGNFNSLILPKFARSIVKRKKINISCILVCNIFNAKHYQPRCRSRWDNLDRFQYRFQPTNLLNSVVSRP